MVVVVVVALCGFVPDTQMIALFSRLANHTESSPFRVREAPDKMH